MRMALYRDKTVQFIMSGGVLRSDPRAGGIALDG